MGVEVYTLVILCLLTFHAVAVNAHNDFDDETSGPKRKDLPWNTYDINKYDLLL